MTSSEVLLETKLPWQHKQFSIYCAFGSSTHSYRRMNERWSVWNIGWIYVFSWTLNNRENSCRTHTYIHSSPLQLYVRNSCNQSHKACLSSLAADCLSLCCVRPLRYGTKPTQNVHSLSLLLVKTYPHAIQKQSWISTVQVTE